jgi:hypothetical protein
MLVPCSAYSSTLKIEAISSSETSVDFQRTTWRYVPEDRTLKIIANYGMDRLLKDAGSTAEVM